MADSSRRSFLKNSVVASAGLCAGANLSGCSLFDDAEMQVCTVADLQASSYLVAKFNRKQIMVTYLEEELVIFSLICRHKKCTVAWEAADLQFQCPCHEGVYDQYGKVIDGPPPGPLYRFKAEVRGDAIWVLNEKTG